MVEFDGKERFVCAGAMLASPKQYCNIATCGSTRARRKNEDEKTGKEKSLFLHIDIMHDKWKQQPPEFWDPI